MSARGAGTPGRRPRAVPLRARLLLAFLAFAGIPALLLTAYFSNRLTRSIELWGNPGIEHTVDSSMGAARVALREFKAHLLEAVEGMAEEGRPAPGGLDALRIYEREGDHYVLREAEPSATGLLVTSEEIDAALLGSRLIERPAEGWLLGLAASDPVARRVVVGGYRVPPELFTQIAAARRGATLFGRLEPYLAFSKGWVWISTAAVAFAVLAAAALLARLMARGLTRPIGDLVAAMERLGRGEPADQLAAPRDPEMAYLVGSFNRMAAELERSRRQLRRAERLAAWQEVAQRVAHEIKNPLTPIQFAIHRLKRELAGGEGAGARGIEAGGARAAGGQSARVSDSLDSILGEVETLRNMAEEFSRLAKLPAPELRPTDAGHLLAEVLDLYRGPGIEIETRIEPGLPAIDADPRLLRQVLTNLMKNAVEAMPGGGRIEAWARLETGGRTEASARLGAGARAAANGGGAGRVVVLEIADSGDGIPPELVDRVGEPYVTTKKARGGSGLGLAMAEKILADHRGRLELMNRPEGGALARIVLPAGGEGGEHGADRAAGDARP